jgi:2'-phosphotransferase
MDSQGYVRCDELLRWQKLKGLGVGMEELVEVVEGNAKKRFALRWVGDGSEEVEQAVSTETDGSVEQGRHDGEEEEEEEEAETETDTQRALQRAAMGDLEPSHYLIRATQGHSLRTIEASAYLTPLRLAEPKSVPETVVHGTFYGAWERILASGGLKSMGRVHVHFATGPSVQDVLGKGKGEGGSPIGDVVISGMRGDAQILIYVDIRRALEAGVEFWRSENGVVLTEGVDAEGGEGKMLSSEFWDVVVEIKAGVGVLWKRGEGVVRELPAELKGRGVPRGKERGKERGGGGGRGKGNNAKPKLRVERDDGELG